MLRTAYIKPAENKEDKKVTTFDIIVLIIIIICAVMAGLYFINRWAYRKMNAQQEMVERTQQRVSAYIIDKRKDKIKNVNMPKVVMDNVPKLYRFINMYFVQAKIGPQILTLICDKRIFEAMPLKKTVKIEVAGLYITNIAGMKSAEQVRAEKKRKKEEAKAAKKAAKKKKTK